MSLVEGHEAWVIECGFVVWLNTSWVVSGGSGKNICTNETILHSLPLLQRRLSHNFPRCIFPKYNLIVGLKFIYSLVASAVWRFDFAITLSA